MILGSRIFDELDYERIVCIGGSLSAGKTRLAFDLALPYWRKGYRVRSNVPHNFVDLDNAKGKLLYKTFCILDEGGEYVREQLVASSITRSAGKADYYAIFSGKRLPHKMMQGMIISPRFDFYVNFGIPAILWSANVKAEKNYKFLFWQVFPQLVHGTYSTLTSSGGIEEFIKQAQSTMDDLARREGQEAGRAVAGTVIGFYDDILSASSSVPGENV
jgi:hypothetical protein